MPKMIIVHTCGECPYRTGHYCLKLKERYSWTEKILITMDSIVDNCPLDDRPVSKFTYIPPHIDEWDNENDDIWNEV